MRRIRVAVKASQAQQGIIVTVSEPELVVGPYDRTQRRLPAGQDRQGNEATVVHSTRAAEAIGDAQSPQAMPTFARSPGWAPAGGTSLSPSDRRRHLQQRLLNDRRQRLASPQASHEEAVDDTVGDDAGHH